MKKLTTAQSRQNRTLVRSRRGTSSAPVRGVNAAVWTSGATVPALSAATFAIGLGVTLATSAQEQGYNVPPSAATQRAMSPPERVDDQLLPGFYPGFSIIATRHSNARRVEQAESDTVFTLSHELVYQNSFGNDHTVQVRYSGSTNKYNEFKDEETSSNDLSLGGNFNIGTKTQLDAHVGYADGNEPRGSSAARAGEDVSPEPDEFEQTTAGLDIRYGTREDLLQFGAGIELSELEYTNNNQGVRDRDTDSIYGRVYYNISPKTSLLAEVRETGVDYIDEGNPRDSTERAVQVGARYELSEITDFEVKVGKTSKDFDSNTLSDYDGSTYLGQMNWRPTEFTSVSAYLSRAVEESSDADASYFVSDLTGVTVNHGLSEKLNLMGYVNSTTDDFSDGRKDDLTDYGVGLDYAVREWLSLNARVGRVKRESNESDVDYSDSFVTIGLSGKRPNRQKQ